MLDEKARSTGDNSGIDTQKTPLLPKLKNIQGLRAIAAMLVVFDHLAGYESRYAGGYSLLGFLGKDIGRFGVEIFFVISGFIMITTNWHEFGTRQAPVRFILRRIVRIVPPYWLITLLLVPVFLAAPQLINSESPYPPRIFESFFLLPQPGLPLLGVGWTLVFEMYFYYVFALSLIAARRYILPIIALWAGVMVVIHQTLYPRFNTPGEYFWMISNPVNLFFIFGILAGYVVMKNWIVGPRLCAIFGAIAATVIFYRPFPTSNQWIASVTLALPMALMLYGLVGSELKFKLCAPAFAVLLGDASYALYLWHFPVIASVGRVSSRIIPLAPIATHVAWCIAMVAFTVWLAIQIYRRIERPMLKWCDARLRRVLATATEPKFPARAEGATSSG